MTTNNPFDPATYDQFGNLATPRTTYTGPPDQVTVTFLSPGLAGDVLVKTRADA